MIFISRRENLSGQCYNYTLLSLHLVLFFPCDVLLEARNFTHAVRANDQNAIAKFFSNLSFFQTCVLWRSVGIVNSKPLIRTGASIQFCVYYVNAIKMALVSFNACPKIEF